MARRAAVVVAITVLLASLVLSLFACSGEKGETGLAEPLRQDVQALRRLRGYARWATRDRTPAAAGGFGGASDGLAGGG